LLLDLEEGSGRVAAHAAANTAVSGAVGGLSACLISLAYAKMFGGGAMFDLVATMNGVLSGLVAITAGCATMELWGAMLTGLIAGLLYLLGSRLLIKLRIDDVVDSIPVHMVNGLWGMLACGLFSTRQLLKITFGIDDPSGLLVNQIIGACCIMTWCVAMSVPFFLALSYCGILRSNVVAEVIGLDVVNLDVSKRGKAISGDIQQDIDTFRDELDRNRSHHNSSVATVTAEPMMMMTNNRRNSHRSQSISNSNSISISISSRKQEQQPPQQLTSSASVRSLYNDDPEDRGDNVEDRY
jgi:Ammonium Transporter Family